MGKPGGETEVFCPYLSVQVKKETWTCHGVKICEFAASELHNTIHESIDLHSDLTRKINMEIANNNIENNTFAYVFTIYLIIINKY